MSIFLGGHTFNHEMLIAVIHLNGILGLDFMKQHNCDLMISKKYLTVKGDKIPCYTKSDGKMNCCRVSISKDVVIPPNSEMIVQGKVVDHIEKDKFCLVEGCDSFSDKTGLLVAKTVFDPKQSYVPLRLANFSEKPVKLYKDTTTATLEQVNVVENITVGATGISCSQGNVLPDYLKDMFSKSSKDLDKSETEQSKQFLIKHQNIFCASSADIGYTTLIKHKIESDNAKPIKEISIQNSSGKKESD